MKPELTLNLLNECPGYRAPRAFLAKLLGEAYAARGEGPAAVNLLLVDDRRIADLNSAYLDHEGPTDVLSFPDGETDLESGQLLLGDIAVSVDTARRESESRGVSARDELALYALHGLLHLLGGRDDTPAGREAMRRQQAAEFARQGLPTDWI